MSTTATEDKMNHAVQNAVGHLQSIMDEFERYNKAVEEEDQSTIDEITERMYETPLSIQVRSGWQTPGQEMVPEEYCILLTTGGPALQITGDLDQYRQAVSAYLEYQDWFTPWTKHILNSQEQLALEWFVSLFYYGE